LGLGGGWDVEPGEPVRMMRIAGKDLPGMRNRVRPRVEETIHRMAEDNTQHRK